jgi:hypothetical protein
MFWFLILGTSVKLYLSTKEVATDEIKYEENLLIDRNTANGTIITSVVPADFDGDNQMDLLVTRSQTGSTNLKVEIHWGQQQQIKLGIYFQW